MRFAPIIQQSYYYYMGEWCAINCMALHKFKPYFIVVKQPIFSNEVHAVIYDKDWNKIHIKYDSIARFREDWWRPNKANPLYNTKAPMYEVLIEEAKRYDLEEPVRKFFYDSNHGDIYRRMCDREIPKSVLYDD